MTNTSEKEQLMSLLFEGDTQLVDLKFFRGFPDQGTRADGETLAVTEEDICREFRSAIEQRRAGTADVSKSFNDDAPKIDVRTLFRS
jgi:hypothetical protein